MARRTAERYQAVILPLQVILHLFIYDYDFVLDAHTMHALSPQWLDIGRAARLTEQYNL